MEVGGSGRAQGTSTPGDDGDDDIDGGHDDGNGDDGGDGSAMQELTSSRALPYISVKC